MPETSGSKSKDNTDWYLKLENLHKAFGTQKVLQGMTLNVRRGETMVIIGRSGEGKSVLLKHIMGLLQPEEGMVTVDGTEVSRLSERQLGPTRRKIGILFQDGALFDSFNVAENVAFPLIEMGMRDRDAIYERVREALSVVELEKHMAKMPDNLSGGMRKRVALARAVVTRPDCILYDEPTAGLDPVVSDSINILIRRLQSTYKVTSVVVTHDLKSVYHIADRVAYLRHGKIYFLGTCNELKNSTDPIIQDFIEGRSRPNGESEED